MIKSIAAGVVWLGLGLMTPATVTDGDEDASTTQSTDDGDQGTAPIPGVGPMGRSSTAGAEGRDRGHDATTSMAAAGEDPSTRAATCRADGETQASATSGDVSKPQGTSPSTGAPGHVSGASPAPTPQQWADVRSAAVAHAKVISGSQRRAEELLQTAAATILGRKPWLDEADYDLATNFHVVMESEFKHMLRGRKREVVRDTRAYDATNVWLGPHGRNPEEALAHARRREAFGRWNAYVRELMRERLSDDPDAWAVYCARRDRRLASKPTREEIAAMLGMTEKAVDASAKRIERARNAVFEALRYEGREDRRPVRRTRTSRARRS